MLDTNFNYAYNIVDVDDELRNSLRTYSTISTFDDMTWDLDMLKKKGLGKGKNTLYFANISLQYMELTKKFALVSLNERKTVSTTGNYINGLKSFYKFLEVDCELPNLDKVDKNIIFAYQDHLENKNDITKSTKETYWTAVKMFFTVMVNYEGVPNVKVIGRDNPFSRNAADRLIEEKYIPIEVINQFDEIFFHEKEIPLEMRCCYWICRLIPSRIGEVISIPTKCIKQYGEEYTLTLNMYKQNGGYIEPEKRLIGFKNEGMGNYLLDLIRKQMDVSESIQHYVGEDDKGLLFTYIQGKYYGDNYCADGKFKDKFKRFETKKTTLRTLSDRAFRKVLNEMAKRYQIKDRHGSIYKITPHQLRHNAITDRIYEGFALIEIKDMTHHKTTAMIEGSYIHPDKEKMVQQARTINDEKDEEGIFRGKIIQNSINALEKIKRMPRSHSLGRLGVCSDISGCKSDMFECLACDCFEPSVDEQGYFEEQVAEWEGKTRLFKNNQYMLENAQYNLELNRMAVDKIIRIKESAV